MTCTAPAPLTAQHVSPRGWPVATTAWISGIRGMTVHALSEDAKAFYAAVGFEASHLDAHLLMITLADLAAA